MTEHSSDPELPPTVSSAKVDAQFLERLEVFVQTDVARALQALAQQGASVSEAGAAVAAALRVVADELVKDTKGSNVRL
jgi:pilus assembly protein TadC